MQILGCLLGKKLVGVDVADLARAGINAKRPRKRREGGKRIGGLPIATSKLREKGLALFALATTFPPASRMNGPLQPGLAIEFVTLSLNEEAPTFRGSRPFPSCATSIQAFQNREAPGEK